MQSLLLVTSTITAPSRITGEPAQVYSATVSPLAGLSSMPAFLLPVMPSVASSAFA